MNLKITTKHFYSSFTADLNEINSLIKRKDITAIINDKNLFFLAFMKAIYETPIKSETFFSEDNSEYTHLKVIDNMMSFTECEKVTNQLQFGIEKIRNFFIKGFINKQNINFITVKNDGRFHFFKNKVNIDLKQKIYVYCELYSEIIEPSLNTLCDYMSTTCETKLKKLWVTSYEPTKEVNANLIEIKWPKNFYLSHKIPPLEIEEEKMNREMKLYNNFIKTYKPDFQIISANEETFWVHSLLLQTYAGPFFEKLLNSDFNESKEKKVELSDYSSCTIQHFINFIYYGSKKFPEQFIFTKKSTVDDLYELLQFSHQYEIDSLRDSTTNLIALLAEEKDFEKIQDLAEKYENKHLKTLESDLFWRVLEAGVKNN